MKVALVLDHAPDYREHFLRLLAEKVELTVIAKSCIDDMLCPPMARRGYRYIELPTKRPWGFVVQRCLHKVLAGESFDLVCCDLNMRHLERFCVFLQMRRSHMPWIWRGQIYGRKHSRILAAMRAFFLRRGDGCLVYTEEIAKRVRLELRLNAISFNNTQTRLADFVQTNYPTEGPLRLLFVGRWQVRKRLERLVCLTERTNLVEIRLVGPGMENENIPENISAQGRVAVFPKTEGEALRAHFEWADIVVAPGHVGLLVMNAAQHGKPIVVDARSEHAPEYLLAKEAGQPFLDFSDEEAIVDWIQAVHSDRARCRGWGMALRAKAMNDYTIENMVEKHMMAFRVVLSRRQQVTLP